jgi:hypothetical protein
MSAINWVVFSCGRGRAGLLLYVYHNDENKCYQTNKQTCAGPLEIQDAAAAASVALVFSISMSAAIAKVVFGCEALQRSFGPPSKFPASCLIVWRVQARREVGNDMLHQ